MFIVLTSSVSSFTRRRTRFYYVESVKVTQSESPKLAKLMKRRAFTIMICQLTYCEDPSVVASNSFWMTFAWLRCEFYDLVTQIRQLAEKSLPNIVSWQIIAVQFLQSSPPTGGSFWMTFAWLRCEFYDLVTQIRQLAEKSLPNIVSWQIIAVQFLQLSPPTGGSFWMTFAWFLTQFFKIVTPIRHLAEKSLPNHKPS